MDEAQKKVFNSLSKRCSGRECCLSELRPKALTALDGDSARAEEVLSALVKEGFVDESRYAGAFARDKASLAGWGPVKIRRALCAKGIGREAIDAALDSANNPKAEEKLLKLLEARRRSLEGDPQARLKLIRYALSRGYEYDSIKDKV